MKFVAVKNSYDAVKIYVKWRRRNYMVAIQVYKNTKL